MIHILHAWIKGTYSQSEQVKSTGEAELTDTALEAIYGGCGQSVYNSYSNCPSHGGYYPQGSCVPHHKYHHHYEDDGYGYNRYDSSSFQHCQPSYYQC